jgi:glycosyltransferase involved in cell wall biosynthesis
MRVCFDEQIFLLQKRGGVSRYFVELIREFSSNLSYGIEPILGFKSTSNEMLFSLSNELGLGLNFDNRQKPIAIALESASHSFGNIRVDLMHHTFYSKLFWQPRFRGPRVSTQYDMIPELFKEKRFFINPHLSKHYYFKNVNHIIAISNSAKSDLCNVWPEIDTPISVTHLATHEAPTPKAKRISGSVLFVGVRQGYKDAETLTRAFAKVPPNLRNQIRFVGGGPFTEAEKSLFTELGIGHLVSQENLSDEELTLAYASSHIFVFPSRYEGFGLPVLEALQHSCRSLLARTEIFQEIAGDAAEYFSPGDETDLTVQLTRILSDDPDTNPNVDAGIQKCKEFSWRFTAKKTSEIYQELLS